MNDSGDYVLHAYGVVDAGRSVALPPTGIGHTPVRLVEVGELGVLVGDLPASEYGEAVWAEHAQDPAWLEPIARSHHEVLQAVVEDFDVLPLRLPGIYPDEHELKDAFTASRGELLERLRFVSGHREWSAHVFLSADAAEDPEPAAAPASGRDYLLMRKQQAAQKGSSRQARQLLATDVYEGLDRAAHASVVNLVQDGALSGRSEPMLLNSAHLVARGEEEIFLAVATELDRFAGAEGGLRLEVSGPWPAYNFTGVRSESRRAAVARE